ncbi:MAG: cation diffusion facilitator family transporter [Bdellovibrionaceae bacterium]|nr:cation diffusion facilitator family transporter [Bdellovibrio sp.]
MATSGSNKVIVVALIANLGIAAAKFVGAYFTKSASLLAESIHSVADCTNQVFLLIGAKQAKKPADEKHPLGYGRESFFWSFMVALLLFLLGGVFAIYEGLHKLTQPSSELTKPGVALGILIVAIALEGTSFWACLKEVIKVNHYPSLWVWFCKSTSSELMVIFMEDLAALLGLTIATVFLVIAIATNNPIWDAMGSIVIGMLLVVVAFLLAREVKSLLLGEKSSTDYKEFINRHLLEINTDMRLLKIISIVTGSNEVLLTMKVHPGTVKQSAELIEHINQMEVVIKKQFPEIRWLFVEPDFIE